MNVAVTTSDPLLFEAIATAAKSAPAGLPEGVMLGEPSRVEHGVHAIGSSEVIMFALNLAAAIPTGILASWLYDKIKGRAAKLTIEQRDVALSACEIEQVIDAYIRRCGGQHPSG